MAATRHVAFFLVVCFVWPACGQKDAVPEITYWQDIAPLYNAHCTECHQEGGSGPFPLDGYDAARKRGNAAAAAIQDRDMPPWHVRDDGSCQAFAHSHWLPDESIVRVRRWVDEGMKEGEPAEPLSLPALPSIDQATAYQVPQLTPAVSGEAYAAHDEYRCFLIDPNLDRDQYITAWNVDPDNRHIVHHLLLMSLDLAHVTANGQTNGDIIAAEEAASPDRPGWPCYGVGESGIEPSQLAVAWVPGSGVTRFPEGSGVHVSAGHRYIVQVHYNLSDPDTIGESAEPIVYLDYAEKLAHEAWIVLVDPFLGSIDTAADSLEAGKPDVPYRWQVAARDVVFAGMNGFSRVDSVALHGVLPHMHERGRAMDMQIIDGEESRCGVDVPVWDFGWQRMYFYDTPVAVSSNTQFLVTCHFDTSDSDEAILPGWGSENEMCLMGFIFVGPTGTFTH